MNKITEKEAKHLLKTVPQMVRDHHDAVDKLDKYAEQRWGEEPDYTYNDAFVDPLQYGDGNLTWNRFCKLMDEQVGKK